jgi:hypothetical protein
MLRGDEILPCLDPTVRSWDDLTRDSNSIQHENTPSDGAECKPATDLVRRMQYSTANEIASYKSAGSLLRTEYSGVNSTENFSGQKTENGIKSMIQQWWPEWIMVLISISILIAIEVILRKFHNVPQPDWKFGLNLSTLVAALATLLRSSLVSVVEQGTSTSPVSLLRFSLSQ